MTKLLENIFRSVNIALVNELAMLCDRLGIDIWEVIDAAATKPFGFMKFQPGPGLGGHCIPIDPFYLSWKAREFDFWTEFIELAGKVNENMPYFCVAKVTRALNSHGKALQGAKVLVLGVAYKADIDDLRESPALKIIRQLDRQGAAVDYHDPFVAELPAFGMHSVDLTRGAGISAYDVVVDRDGPLRHRLRRRRHQGAARGRPAQRHRRSSRRRQGLEALKRRRAASGRPQGW